MDCRFDRLKPVLRRVRQFSRALRRTLSPGLALLLVACAGVEVTMPSSVLELPQMQHHVPAEALKALAQAKPCCASLAELPFRPIEREGLIKLEIDSDSPAFVFDSGKSFFAAFRLPDWPRPLALHIRTSDSPSVLSLDPLRPIFGPAVMVLDAQFRVLQLMAGFTTKDVGPSGSKPGIMVEGEMYVGDLTQNAAYLVVLTTDELRSLNAVSNGERIHGFSPIGTVELEIRSAPFLALPVHYRGSAMLMDPGRPLSGDLFWRANTLFIDSSGLHYVEDVDGRWIERLSIPNTKLVAARVRVPFASNARLELDTAQGPGSPLVRQTFAILPPLGSSAYELDHVAGIVAQGIASGWHAERVSVVAATTAPVVEFRDPPTLSSGAGSRIADKALAGGVVTAGVCGICQTGLCPPQMLLSCAGLFAVGAAIGGAVGVGGELLAANAPAAPKAPTLSAQQVQGASPVVSSAAGTMLGQEALRACMQRRAAEGDAWVAQGRRAELALESGSAPFVLEAAVQRVSLVPMGQPGQAVDDLPVQLLVDGKVVLRHAPPGPQEAREWQRTVSWQGPSYTLVQWSAPDGRVLQDSLRGACEGLAESLLRQAQALWLDAK